MEDIARIADRVLVVNDAGIAMFDDTRSVFAKGEELEQMGLQIPQITKIAMKLREKGYPLPSGVLTVDQAFRELLQIMGREEKKHG